MSTLDRLYLSATCRMKRAIEEIKEFCVSEDGVSNVVATIIILLIVVILIGVFWDRLSTWVTGIMDQIFGSDLPSSSDMGGNP